MASTLSIKSIAEQAETPTTHSFLFELAGKDLDYRPGQYITVKILDEIDDPRGPQRPFTLSSSPDSNGVISISVNMTGSRFKQHLSQLAASDESADKHLQLRGPMGDFTLDTDRPAVLIAGGIGITPFYSMLCALSAQQHQLPVTLVYSNRTPEEIVFREQLDDMAREHGWLEILHTITRPEESESEWSGRTGHIDAELLKHASERMQKPVFYICGPPDMVAGMSDLAMGECQVPEADLRVEKFSGY